MKGVMYMRKIIIGVLAAALLSGCGASPTGYTADTSEQEETTMTTKKTTDAIDQKLTEALAAIESAATEAISQIQQAATTTTVKATTTTAIPEPKTITLDVETRRGDGTLTFVKAETRPNKNQIRLYYETSDETAKMPSVENGAISTTLTGKSGNKYYTDSFGGVGNKGDIIFDEITDFSDLSTVTLTYAFEGFDPVTVTFDIPGI